MRRLLAFRILSATVALVLETVLSREHDSEEDDRRETSHDHGHGHELELESRCTNVCPGSPCRTSLTHHIYLPSLLCLRRSTTAVPVMAQGASVPN